MQFQYGNRKSVRSIPANASILAMAQPEGMLLKVLAML
jgi:hypothetical protein